MSDGIPDARLRVFEKFQGSAGPFWGWVPILTSELLVVDDVQRRVAGIRKDWADTRRTKDCEYTDFQFATSGFLRSFKIGIPEVGLLDVEMGITSSGLFRFQYTYNISMEAGMVDPSVNFVFPTIIYKVLRDIYHDHVHHEVKDDALLQVVEANDEKSAVTKLRLQYENKIKIYQRDIKQIKDSLVLNIGRIVFVRPMLKRLKLMNTAVGEFVYAKSFLQLHGLTDKVFAFENATSSIRLLLERQYWRIGTFLASLGILLALIASLPILKKICLIVWCQFL